MAKPTYMTTMKKFALEKTSKKEPWIILDFCQLGFIGTYSYKSPCTNVFMFVYLHF